MADGFYFDGDPATESARRHLERVLNEPAPRRRRWPALVAAVAGAAAWYLWPRRFARRASSEPGSDRRPMR